MLKAWQSPKTCHWPEICNMQWQDRIHTPAGDLSGAKVLALKCKQQHAYPQPILPEELSDKARNCDSLKQPKRNHRSIRNS